VDRSLPRPTRGQPAGVPIYRAGAPPRINIRGNSGSGKTTLAAELARRLAVPHIELDALHHGPNWAEPTPEEFRAKVQAAMDAAPGGWVIDGSYEAKLHGLVTDAADTVAWLDVPLPLILWRLWRRTSHRVRHKVELWNGNRESWATAFWGWDSLFMWAIRSYFRHQREWPVRYGAHPGYIRLRGDQAARAWLEHTVAIRAVSPDLSQARTRSPGS
jgi:adenylate kinase family enzyme